MDCSFLVSFLIQNADTDFVYVCPQRGPRTDRPVIGGDLAKPTFVRTESSVTSGRKLPFGLFAILDA
jgi:hypothetical protein